MGRVDHLGVRIGQAVEQRLLNMGVDVRLWLLDQEKVRERMFGRLIFELEQLERQVDEIGASQAEFVDRALIAIVGFAHEQPQRLKKAVGVVRQAGADGQGRGRIGLSGRVRYRLTDIASNGLNLRKLNDGGV
ncbi:hypothetical protein D3C80_1134370 [compost metagenome]